MDDFSWFDEAFMRDAFQPALADSLLQSSKSCVKLMDTRGKILAVNRYGLELMGISDPAMFCGQILFDLWDGREAEMLRAAFAEALTNSANSFVASVPTMRGEMRTWRVELFPMTGPDTVVTHVLVVSHDVTESWFKEIVMQDEIQTLRNTVASQAQSIRALNATLDEADRVASRAVDMLHCPAMVFSVRRRNLRREATALLTAFRRKRAG